MEYMMNDCMLSLKEEWEDRSTNLLLKKDIEGYVCNLVVFRIEKIKNATIEQIAMDAFEKSKAEIKSLQMLNKEKGQVGKYNAFSIETSGTMQGHYLEQVILFVDAPQRILSFTFTCPGRITDNIQKKIKEIFSAITIKD